MPFAMSFCQNPITTAAAVISVAVLTLELATSGRGTFEGYLRKVTLQLYCYP